MGRSVAVVRVHAVAASFGATHRAGDVRIESAHRNVFRSIA